MLTRLRVLALATAWGIPACPAWGDDPPAVTPILAGTPAPHDGLLVTPERLRAYLDVQVQVEACESRVAVRDRAVAQAAAQLGDCRGAQASWWQRNKAWAAFAAGLALGGTAAAWGATR